MFPALEELRVRENILRWESQGKHLKKKKKEKKMAPELKLEGWGAVNQAQNRRGKVFSLYWEV